MPVVDCVSFSKLMSEDKFLGCLVGLAIGDALGAAVECMPAGSFKEVTGMRDGGKYGLLPGQWTDDTSLALCMAESIIQNQGTLDYHDFHAKFRAYYEQGHLTSTGECFDIGKCTLQGMNRYKSSKNVFSGGTEDYCSGNGSIMRLAPIPMLYALRDHAEGITHCGDSSKLTHGGKFAVECCELQGAIIMKFLNGTLTKEQLFTSSPRSLGLSEVSEEVSALIPGDYANKKFPGDIQNSGFSVKALESALWCFYHTEDYSSGVLKAVNLGDDADTVAAIYGQIAGAYYGLGSIPKEWVTEISFLSLIDAMGRDLLVLAQGNSVEENAKFYEMFNEMERAFKDIYRKFSPGPRMYSSVEQFDADVENFRTLFCEREESRVENLIISFDKAFRKARKTLAQRCNRPKMGDLLSGKK